MSYRKTQEQAGKSFRILANQRQKRARAIFLTGSLASHCYFLILLEDFIVRNKGNGPPERRRLPIGCVFFEGFLSVP